MSSDLNNGAGPTEEEIRAYLKHAMDYEPGLMRRVVQEVLERGEAEEKNEPPAPEPAQPKREFQVKVHQSTLVLDNPAQAEDLRASLVQHEADLVVRQGDKWIYVRNRAWAEEVNGESDGQRSGVGSGEQVEGSGNDAGGAEPDPSLSPSPSGEDGGN